MPPDTLVLALSAKRPKPPPVSGLRPAQRSVSRSEAASAASVPSILSVGRTLMAPSKASFSGAPLSRSLRPERSPASAAAKSVSVIEASTGSLCQTKRPVAAKLLEIDGQASASSTSCSVSAMPRAASRRTMVPPLDADFRERGAPGPAGRPSGPSARASRSHQPGPVRAAVLAERHADARAHQRDVGDLDAADEQREEAQPRGQPVGGERAARRRRPAPRRRS